MDSTERDRVEQRLNQSEDEIAAELLEAGQRLTFDESMALIRERYSNAIDELGKS
jgi:hypothetical protein